MIILPSLEIVPAKYNGSTLLSQIPIDGTGDFTVSRTTSPVTGQSTRVNALGQIELVADNVPRLDYPISGGCPALLVEPSATNLALQSENFLTTWSPTNITVTTGSTAAFTAPDGSTDANLLTSISSISCNVYQNISFASGTYTISVFGKAGSSSILSIGNISRPTRGAWFNLAAGAVTGTVNGGTASMQNYGNGWYRCIYTSSGMVSGTNTLIVSLSDAANQTTATSGTNIYVWGAQLETGSVATSYIPTTTAAVTRSADVIRKTGITSLIGQSEGTVYFEVEVTDEARDKWIFSLDSSSNSFIQAWISTSRTINVQIQNAGSVVMTTLGSSALSVGYHKLAFAYNTATNGCQMFVDGVQNPVASRTITGAGLPAFNNFTFGSFLSTQSDTLKGHVRAGALYQTRLTDTQLALLTSPYTSYSSMASALSYTLG